MQIGRSGQGANVRREPMGKYRAAVEGSEQRKMNRFRHSRMKVFPVAASEGYEEPQSRWEQRSCPDENTQGEEGTALEYWSRGS